MGLFYALNFRQILFTKTQMKNHYVPPSLLPLPWLLLLFLRLLLLLTHSQDSALFEFSFPFSVFLSSLLLSLPLPSIFGPLTRATPIKIHSSPAIVIMY